MADGADDDIALIRSEAARSLADLASEATLRGLLTRRGEFDRPLWAAVGALGWLGAGLPEADGGLGLGLAARCAIAEAFGRALGSAPYAASACAAAAIARFGPAALKAELLPAAVSGEAILTVAAFEAGEAGLPRQPAARLSGGKLSGRKVAVSAGAFAHHALVHARADEGAGVVAVVDLGQPGVRREVLETVDNSRGYADLAFDDVPAAVLGGGAIGDVLDDLAVVSAFEAVGGAEACLYAARDYALQRRVFGQPIGAFQAIKHGLADLYVLIQIARGAAQSAVRADAAEFPLAAAAARLAAIRAYDTAASEAMQAHGGLGVTWEAALHLHYRRARCLALEWGGEPHWRNRLLDRSLEGLAA